MTVAQEKKKALSRMTVQRRTILEELRKVTSHPSAAEVYLIVRQQLPKVSLGTVYRNLEVMSDEGLILKLEHAGTERRYDGNPRNHSHIRCVKCGRMDDVRLDAPEACGEAAARTSGYRVTGYHLEFMGLCPKCRCGCSGRRGRARVKA